MNENLKTPDFILRQDPRIPTKY